MSYIVAREKPHTHRFFIDSDTQDQICLCGRVKGVRGTGVTKFHSERNEYDGRWYQSKLEAEHARNLDIMLRKGVIRAWTPQYRISIDIAGQHICNYFCDFMVTYPDDSRELHETKGLETSLFRIKRKLLETVWLPAHPEFTYHIFK